MKVLYVGAPFNIKTHCSTLLSTISTAAIFHSARSITWRKYLAEGPPQMVPLKEQFSSSYVKYGTWNVQRRKAFWLICVQNPLSSEKLGEGPFSEGESVHRLHFGMTGRTIGKKGGGVKQTRKRWYRKTSRSLTSKILQKCFLNENDVNCGNTNLNSWNLNGRETSGSVTKCRLFSQAKIQWRSLHQNLYFRSSHQLHLMFHSIHRLRSTQLNSRFALLLKIGFVTLDLPRDSGKPCT